MLDTDNQVYQSQPAAVLYARVSSERQAKHDLSIPDQLKQMRDYCHKNGISVVREFEDVRTGTSMDRLAMTELKSLVEHSQHKINLVIVHSLSRFSRNLIESEVTRRDLARHGAELISITQPIDDGASGNLVRTIITLFDEHSSHETAKHVRRSMEENARQGFWNGGVRPFGFRPVNVGVRGDAIKKKLEIDPIEAEEVRHIYHLYMEGDGSSGPMGIKRIAEQLNTKNRMRRGSKWTTGQIHRVLTDRIYMGEREFRKGQRNVEMIIVPVPSVIDASFFSDVQLRLRSRNPQKNSPRKTNSPVLLTGVAVCSHCGGGMILGTGKSGAYRYYACSNKVRKGNSVCLGKRIPMKQLDDKVMEFLGKVLLSKHRNRAVLEELASKVAARNFEDKSRLRDLQRELTDRQNGLARLYDGVHRGIFDIRDPQFANALAKAKTERDIAQTHFQRLDRRQQLLLNLAEEQIRTFGDFLRKMILEGPVSFRKAYLGAFIEQVVVKGNEVFVSLKSEVYSANAVTSNV